jgi:hypothetical protein
MGMAPISQERLYIDVAFVATPDDVFISMPQEERRLTRCRSPLPLHHRICRDLVTLFVTLSVTTRRFDHA